MAKLVEGRDVYFAPRFANHAVQDNTPVCRLNDGVLEEIVQEDIIKLESLALVECPRCKFNCKLLK
jgi:hypothetical protein